MSKKRILTDLLLQLHESNKGIYFTHNSGEDVFLSYRNLLTSARRILNYLYEKGIQKGDELIFQFSDNHSFVITFWACQLGGIIPVPVSISRSDEVRLKLLKIWKTLRNSWLISDILPGSDIHQQIPDEVATHKIIYFRNIRYDNGPLADIIHAHEDDTAFIQFSSGSTGQPKGVVLTHKNILTNLHAIEVAVRLNRNADFVCSWTPLTHDLGIIGGHLVPVYAGIGQNLIATNCFLKDPTVWLQRMSKYNATLSTSPNFGFHYTTRHADHQRLTKSDLSSVKHILNGAEPISMDVCTRFTETFRKYGLRKNVILPVYGMAEACLAVTIPVLDQPVKAFHLHRTFLNPGDAIMVSNSVEAVCFVAVGRPVAGCSVRLWHNNKYLDQYGIIGEILIKGENVSQSYYGHTDDMTDHDGWLNTGDLGFMADGELVITGRKKDIIFSRGQNYYPHDLERVAAQLDEIDAGKIVFGGHTNFDTGTEEVIAFVHYRSSTDSFILLAEKVKHHVSEKAGVMLDHIIPVRKIPKTTSGKVQRYVLVENYRQGVYDAVVQEIEKNKLFGKKKTVTAANDIERQLIAIWEDILETSPIGVDDNFIELGGDSVNAVRISARMQDMNYPCEPAVIIERKTIRSIAEYISSNTSPKNDDTNTDLHHDHPEYSITHLSNDDLEDVFSKS